MPPRGRLPSRRVSRVSRKGKVSRPENPQQWDKLLSKAGLKLALVLFVDMGQGGHRLRTMMSELASQSDYRNVEFVIVDMEKAGNLARQLGVEQGIVVAVYQNKQLLERSRRLQREHPGSQVFQYLHKHVGRVNSEISEKNKLRRKIMWIGGTILGILTLSAGVVGYILYQNQDGMSDDDEEDGEEETRIFSLQPSLSRKHKNNNQWWSGEEASEYDQWSEYIDDDRDNFEPFPIRTDDQSDTDNIN